MEGVRPVQTPLSPSMELYKTSGNPLSDPQSYRTIVGALQYATLTRLNLSFVVNKVCQFMQISTDVH